MFGSLQMKFVDPRSSRMGCAVGELTRAKVEAPSWDLHKDASAQFSTSEEATGPIWIQGAGK